MLTVIIIAILAVSSFYWIKWLLKDRKSKWCAFWRFINVGALGIFSIVVMYSLLTMILWSISVIGCAIMAYWAFKDDKKSKDVR